MTVSVMHEAQMDEPTWDKAFHIIRGLTNKVIVYSRPDGGSEIELVG